MRFRRMSQMFLKWGFLLCAVCLTAMPGAHQPAGQDENPPKIPRNRPLRSIKIPADKGWVDCGWHIFQGQSIEIWAEGEVSCGKENSETCGPAGYPNSEGGAWKPMPKVNTGALIARIGNKSTRYFPVGTYAVLKAWMPGKLYLRVNDSNVFDNEGEFTAYLGFH